MLKLWSLKIAGTSVVADVACISSLEMVFVAWTLLVLLSELVNVRNLRIAGTSVVTIVACTTSSIKMVFEAKILLVLVLLDGLVGVRSLRIAGTSLVTVVACITSSIEMVFVV